MGKSEIVLSAIV